MRARAKRQRTAGEKDKAARMPVRRREKPKKRKDLDMTYDEEAKEYRLTLRSTGSSTKCKLITAVLAEPAQDEECPITLEPMAGYSLPFLEAGACVVEDQPELTKASLPCGHSFNALALLYHFAKNAMTCPCCRAGHDKVVLAETALPLHLRRAFTRHLLQLRTEETRDQIASDALLAANTLRSEVGNSYLPSSMADALLAANTLQSEVSSPYLPSSMARIILFISAWDSMEDDPASSSATPPLVLQIPLFSSLSQTGMVFECYGYNLHHLNLNLRLLPFRPRAFDLSVAVISQFHAGSLFHTARFPMEGPGTRMVFATQPGQDGTFQGIEVETSPFADGIQNFTGFRWTVPPHVFAAYLGA